MNIPMLFGVLSVSFIPNKPMPWTIHREIRRILFVNGKADKDNRIFAIKKVRELTGCGLVDAVKYTNKFFRKEDRIKV